MDLKVYYKKIRDTASTIPEEFAVMVSKESPDGGKAGVMSEVTRQQAARLVVEGRARLATKEESKKFHDDMREARLAGKKQE